MAFGEALLLFGLVHAQPVLEQQEAVVHQQLLEYRRLAQELLVLMLAAIAHHPLDAGAVVPTAVEEDDLAAGRQMGELLLRRIRGEKAEALQVVQMPDIPF